MVGYAIHKYVDGIYVGKVATMFSYRGALDYMHIMRDDGVTYRIEDISTHISKTHENTIAYKYVKDTDLT